MVYAEHAERHTERLWTLSDGTFCELATEDAPPSYTVSLIKGAEVLRARRLYGLASAQMLALGWREGGPHPDGSWMRMAAGRHHQPVG